MGRHNLEDLTARVAKVTQGTQGFLIGFCDIMASYRYAQIGRIYDLPFVFTVGRMQFTPTVAHPCASTFSLLCFTWRRDKSRLYNLLSFINCIMASYRYAQIGRIYDLPFVFTFGHMQ